MLTIGDSITRHEAGFFMRFYGFPMPLRPGTAAELRASLERLRLELVALHDLRIQPGLQNWTARERTLTVAIAAVERQVAEAEREGRNQ